MPGTISAQDRKILPWYFHRLPGKDRVPSWAFVWSLEDELIRVRKECVSCDPFLHDAGKARRALIRPVGDGRRSDLEHDAIGGPLGQECIAEPFGGVAAG